MLLRSSGFAAADSANVSPLGAEQRQGTWRGGTTALLREPDGTIVSVQQGDAAGRMTVTALKPDAVYLSDGNGHSQVLRMPA